MPWQRLAPSEVSGQFVLNQLTITQGYKEI